MSKVRTMLGTTLVALVAVSAAFAGPAAADNAGDEAAFLASLNGVRSSQGLPALARNDALTGVARAWAGAMAAAGSISHNPSLSSQSPDNWARLGENVGMGMDVASVHNAFVNSPSHYRNMVDGAFDAVGIGVVRNSSGTLFVTVDFMATRAAAPAPAPAPTAAPAAAPAAPVRVAAPAPAPARPAPAPAAPAPAAAAAPAPVAAPAPPFAPAAPAAAEPAPEPAPVADVAPPATPAPAAAARTTSVAMKARAADSSPDVAVALVCAGLVLAVAAGGLVARRPERRAPALARR